MLRPNSVLCLCQWREKRTKLWKKAVIVFNVEVVVQKPFKFKQIATNATLVSMHSSSYIAFRGHYRRKEGLPSCNMSLLYLQVAEINQLKWVTTCISNRLTLHFPLYEGNKRTWPASRKCCCCLRYWGRRPQVMRHLYWSPQSGHMLAKVIIVEDKPALWWNNSSNLRPPRSQPINMFNNLRYTSIGSNSTFVAVAQCWEATGNPMARNLRHKQSPYDCIITKAIHHLVIFIYHRSSFQSRRRSADRCACCMWRPLIITSRLVVQLNLISQSGCGFILSFTRTRCPVITLLSLPESRRRGRHMCKRVKVDLQPRCVTHIEN